MKKILLLLLLLVGSHAGAFAGDTLRVLFIGNSYTYVNDLPLLIRNLALSSGDDLVYSVSAPGGQTFQQHCSNSLTLSLLSQGGWDRVVLQEQSQRPSFSDAQVANEVYPYARKLDSLVHLSSPCAKTVFYMTWGRKNGDAGNCAAWPPICTYQGMDSLLQLRYTIMADNNNAWLSPVAKVWRRLRTQNPGINLYDADESHPSLQGSYAAACTFYTLLFGKSPQVPTYTAGLSPADVAAIRSAAQTVVFDSLQHWHSQDPVPVAAFTAAVSGTSVQMTNNSQLASSYYWTFGDNTSSTLVSPSHTYAGNGTYNVTLAAIMTDGNCKDTTRMTKQVVIGPTAVVGPGQDAGIGCYPNPAGDRLFVQGLKGRESLEVTDMAGRKVMVYSRIEGKTAVLATAELGPGLYLLQVARDGAVVRTLRFSKK